MDQTLRDLEEQVYQRGYPERATIDQIVVFVENGESKFKGRFLDVVKQLDRDHWEFEGNEANSLVERLRAISAAFQLINDGSDGFGGEAELFPRFRLDQKDRTRMSDLCTSIRKIVNASEQFD